MFLEVTLSTTASSPALRDVAAFDEMVEYARSRGWFDARGAALRAHCERGT